MPVAWTRLVAFRHAPTLAAGLCVGDAEVACAMSAQNAAAEIHSQLLGCSPACVWTSERQRCLQPAQVLASELSVPCRIDERLREISLGRWQLQPWTSIEATQADKLESWMANWVTEAPPGGELAAELLRRVESWWSELGAGEHLLVGHAGVVRALRVLVHGTPWSEAMRIEVPYLRGEWFEQA